MRVAIIGAGFSGIGMACGLLRAGVTDFVLLERAREVGGTWRDNVYPGAACDIPADLYSFSFAPNPDWSHRYPRQEELLHYLRDVADRFGVTPHIRFGTEVESGEWDAAAAVWRIATNAASWTADVLVSASGPFIDPAWPAIPGSRRSPARGCTRHGGIPPSMSRERRSRCSAPEPPRSSSFPSSGPAARG
ncbi:flavin-containing monooxygenase [Pseudolysinimonas kribbensis]|uniref:flavin-containing monooxygenase n=1 Tax=Pseudolysinimonas kribbensis TaxID=433641 RepID=UPI0024E0C353|nr:NAD(P)/FAD-dependent oxidoreductase [Pseudolysinimonas kribbensis]